jgi:hypothetical protein
MPKFPEFDSYKELHTFDIIGAFEDWFNSGVIHIDPETKKIDYRQLSIIQETPWDHTCPHPELRCGTWQMVYKALGFIPTHCIKCWKVVVKPRTIDELFALRDLQYEKGWAAKCGIELRMYTPGGLYGGYFYNRSKEEGEDKYRLVREAVDKEISPDVPVILKRYCTEFERDHGDSLNYERPAHADAWEELVHGVFHPRMIEEKPDKIEPWYVKLHTYKLWIQWAWRHDRENALKYNDMEDLEVLPRQYHKDLLNED